jgi:hypothetical protein
VRRRPRRRQHPALEGSAKDRVRMPLARHGRSFPSRGRAARPTLPRQHQCAHSRNMGMEV